MERFVVKVCFGKANFASDVTYLDLEHQKVPLAKPVLNGSEWIKSRRNPIMIGMAYCFEGLLYAEAVFGWDDPNGWVNSEIPNGNTIYYSARRASDEMILKGLFTSNRRAFLDTVPEGWPTIKGQFEFVRIPPGNIVNDWDRELDIYGADIAECDWDSRDDNLENLVVIHCLRDVLQLLPLDTLPVKTLDKVCRFVESNDYALEMICEE